MSKHALKTVVLSSLEKIFPEIEPQAQDLHEFSCLQNEPLSFQIAYKLDSDRAVSQSVYAQIETDLPVSLYAIGFVPVFQAYASNLNDEYRSGLFPDRLLQKKVNPKIGVKRFPWLGFQAEEDPMHISAQIHSWRGLWITVNEDKVKLKAGTYPLTIRFHSYANGEVLAQEHVQIQVIGAALPKQKLRYTNWFHCDCICDAYAIEPFTDRFWGIFADYVKKATINGMNTLLTPCFTPPLDTPIGCERKTVQLIDVRVENGQYAFDFSKLEKFMDIAKANGIEYFEHSHFFSQWGALHAPKIMATVDGKYKRIFGWETVSWGKKYKAFLHAYIPALLEFLKARNMDKKFMFHVSDEPAPEHHAAYKKAKASLGNLLDGYIVGDALSKYDFYEDGTVKMPIVATNHIADFYQKAKHFWAYYTGEQCYDGMSNRKLNCSGERNRMLGIQLYMHDIEGFLHWGYNFWYDTLSQGFVDPSTDGTFFGGANPGTGYLVYPSIDGTCVQSIRQKVFYEGINDMRALQVLEKLEGKARTRAFVQDFFGEVTFYTHPGTAERLLQFRKLLNARISSLVKGEQ